MDTEGNLLAVKVTGAEQSDQQGGKRLLLPLHGALPRLQLIWGDRNSGGTFVIWLKEHLGWKMQTVLRAKIPTRGLLVLDRRGAGLGGTLSQWVCSPAEKMGGGAHVLVDLPLAPLGS